ncbi:MAG: hypothetical protein ACYSWP_17980 [Planctomycetota bacterium]|jgi:hypothetical protein
METKEQKNNEQNSQQQWPDFSCCQPQGDSPQMPDCCKDFGKDQNYGSMMSACMKACRWFPIIPVIFGIALLLLGYYLHPEITRILWMIAAGFVVIMGVLGLLMTSRMKKLCC